MISVSFHDKAEGTRICTMLLLISLPFYFAGGVRTDGTEIRWPTLKRGTSTFAHASRVELALSDAVNAMMACQTDEPIAFLVEQLERSTRTTSGMSAGTPHTSSPLIGQVCSQRLPRTATSSSSEMHRRKQQRNARLAGTKGRATSPSPTGCAPHWAQLNRCHHHGRSRAPRFIPIHGQ